MQIRELGHVVLYVTDLERSERFYRETLGFREIAKGRGFALFSSGRTHHELLLLETGVSRDGQERPGRPGLYHIGFKIGESKEELKTAYQELLAAGVTVTGTADHTVTNSLYILDPDGNELELYADVSDIWKTDPSAILAPVRGLEL